MYMCSMACYETNSGAVHQCQLASGPLNMVLKALIMGDVLVRTPLAARLTRPRTAAMYHALVELEIGKK